MKLGMLAQSDERRQQFEAEARRIVKKASEKNLTLRVLGSLAFRFHCPQYGYLQKQLGRAYTDIDYAGYKNQASHMASLLTPLGYKEDMEINLFYAGQRMVFTHPDLDIHLDIFFDKLNFCHEVSWINRLEVENLTLPLAEMLLEKMQIVKINEKDIIDTIMLLLDHPFGDQDEETINISRIGGLCAQDWGLWRTVTMNLEKVARLGQSYTELGEAEKARLVSQVSSALEHIHRQPKSFGWKLRAKVGDRVKWYQEVDEVG